MKKSLLLAACLLSGSAAFAQWIPAVSVTGTGGFADSASLISDGFIPAEHTWYNDPTNVFWYASNVSFVIDLGSVYTITDILASLDNNDNYKFEYSLDGVNYTTLFITDSSYGAIAASYGGMDTLVSNTSASAYFGTSTYEVDPSMAFSAFNAEYIRVSAYSGDGYYAIGEVKVFGTSTSAVPEPSTYGLMGAAGLFGLGALRRFRRRS